MKKFVLVLALLALLFVGTVYADDVPITKVVGSIQAPTKFVTLTPPQGPLAWNLSFDSPTNNSVTIGNIHVVSNCNYTISVQSSAGGYLMGEEGAAMSFPLLKNPVVVWDGYAYRTVERWEGSNHITSRIIYTGSPGTVDIPFKLQQKLSPSDAGLKSPTIVFGFLYNII